MAVQSCSGLVSGVGLAEVLMGAGLGFVWGLFRFGKRLISGMLLGELKVDFESVWGLLGTYLR